MNDENLNPELKQNNPNVANNTENTPVFGQGIPPQPNISNSSPFFSEQPQIPQNDAVKPPKNKKTILTIIVISIVVVVIGVVGFFVINNLNKSKTSSESGSSNNVSNSENSAVAFASEDDKQYIKDSNDQYGIRFDNQVILTATVPIDGASTNPKEYDGVAVVAIDVSECNHIVVSSESMLTCYLTEDEADSYYVTASSNSLSAYDNFREIARTYSEQSAPSLVSKGTAYEDVEVYTGVYKNGILHAYFGHLGVSGQYSPYFFVNFNKNDKNDKSFDDAATVDAYYKKMSIINVPSPVIE